MASMFGASIFSPSSSPASYHRYGSRISYYPVQRFSFLKLNDIAHNNSNSFLTVKAQVSVSEIELPITKKTLDSLASELPGCHPHLSPLINELLDGTDVPSAMDPWIHKLTIRDWDSLVRSFGNTDWTISWQIVSFFKEKSSLLDESVLWPKNIESEASMDEGEDSEDAEDTEERLASPSPSPEAAAEAASHDMSNATEESHMGLKKSPPIFLLYKTLAKVLARNKKFDDLQRLLEQMQNDGIQPNFSFYGVVLNLYITENLTEKVYEIIAKMETAGFKPTKFTYEKIAYMHLKKEVPNLTAATGIMRDLMAKGFQVDVGIFKNLLKAYWRMKDVAGAEEVLQAMQASGYTPDLKVVLKVMNCHKQAGNHKRILELKEILTNGGIQHNTGVYDQLIYAYCKAGLLDKAKETLVEYESVLGRKPTLVAYNMLVNGYGKQGLYEEALEIFDQIQANKYRPSVVSYASIIFALAQVGNLNKAAELYRSMVKQGIHPKMYIYLSLIQGYTKLDWTREGHKMAKSLRRSPLEMTPEAYGVILILYVEGHWYVHAASVLKEIEKGSVALGAAAMAALVRSFSIVGSKLTSLAKAVETSDMEICKLLTSLFITKLEPAPEEAVLLFLEKFKDKDEAHAAIYNAFMECLWRRGLKTGARRILSSARNVYAQHTLPQLLETEWVLDVRGLSAAGAKVALMEWLIGEGKDKEEKPKDDVKIVLVTGDDFHLNVIQDNRILKRALSSMLESLGSPFVESPDESKKLEATAPKVMKWVRSDKVKQVLNFIDEPSVQ